MGTQSAAPVLIVDDDEDIRDTLRAVMEDTPHPVAVVESARAALDYLRATSLSHVVLLDFLMPPENARPLLRAVEQEATLRRHCYVLIPASSPTRFPEEDQRLIAKICTEVIRKPFEIDDLFRAVDAAAAQLPVSVFRRLAVRTRCFIDRQRWVLVADHSAHAPGDLRRSSIG